MVAPGTNATVEAPSAAGKRRGASARTGRRRRRASRRLPTNAPPGACRKETNMDTKLLLTVFSTVFLAELADKTQLATMLYSARSPDARWTVFAGSAGALVLASAIGVLAGDVVARTIDTRMLSRVAGAAFIAIGIWTLARA